MHIQCVLDALMLSMKRWARFPRSWTGYASPLYSYTSNAHCLSAGIVMQGAFSQNVSSIWFQYWSRHKQRQKSSAGLT